MLKPLNELKSDISLELKDVLNMVKEILSKNAVEKPVIIDEENNVKKNAEILYALYYLGTHLVLTSYKDAGILTPLESLGFYDDVKGNSIRVYRSTMELLYRGWPTPLVLLRSLSNSKIRVWAKLESYNPFSNSIKDRAGWYMFKKALEKGLKITAIYEATSTNTGLALAALAAIHRIKARFYIPSTIQKVSDILLKILGAEVIRMLYRITMEYLDLVDKYARRNGATHLNQFINDANFEVHLKFTAKELDYQLRNANIQPTVIIGGIGTSGHMSAIAFYFKSRFSEKVKIFCVQPAKDSRGILGIRRIETGMKWIHWVDIDGIMDVKYHEAIESAIKIAKKEGILIGLSSGAVVAAFEKLLKNQNIDEGDFVLIFPDHGFKYIEQFQEYLR